MFLQIHSQTQIFALWPELRHLLLAGVWMRHSKDLKLILMQEQMQSWCTARNLILLILKLLWKLGITRCSVIIVYCRSKFDPCLLISSCPFITLCHSFSLLVTNSYIVAFMTLPLTTVTHWYLHAVHKLCANITFSCLYNSDCLRTTKSGKQISKQSITYSFWHSVAFSQSHYFS